MKKNKKWQRKVCFHFHEWLFSWKKTNYKSVQKCLWKSFKSAMWIIEAQRIAETITGLLVRHYASTWLLPDTPIRSGYHISSLLASACYTTVRSSIEYSYCYNRTLYSTCTYMYVQLGHPKFWLFSNLLSCFFFLLTACNLAILLNVILPTAFSLRPSVRLSVSLSMRDFWGVSDRSLLPMCKFPLTRNIRKVV